DHRVVAITLPRLAHPDRRAQRPAAVLVVADQRREAGVRIEPRRAQPVDRSGARHQRAGEGVPDQPVVLDLRRHAFIPGCQPGEKEWRQLLIRRPDPQSWGTLCPMLPRPRGSLRPGASLAVALLAGIAAAASPAPAQARSAKAKPKAHKKVAHSKIVPNQEG